MNKPTLLLFDSNYIIQRAKYGMPPLESEEAPTAIIFNFIKTIITLGKKFGSKHMVFSFDSKRSYRKLLYTPYKATRREKTPDEKARDILMYNQGDALKEKILKGLGFNNVICDEWLESDDTMAQFVLDYHDKYNIIMVSRDMDMLQMLDYCTLCWPVKTDGKNEWVTHTRDDFIKQWGINPKQWIDVKAVGGCKSDEIMGIKGVGEKTYCKYLNGLMNPKTKTFKNILMLSPFFKERNEKLVKLPFEGTPSHILKKDVVTKQKFIDMCDKHEFVSLLMGSGVSDWKDIFCKLTPKIKVD